MNRLKFLYRQLEQFGHVRARKLGVQGSAVTKLEREENTELARYTYHVRLVLESADDETNPIINTSL